MIKFINSQPGFSWHAQNWRLAYKNNPCRYGPLLVTLKYTQPFRMNLSTFGVLLARVCCLHCVSSENWNIYELDFLPTLPIWSQQASTCSMFVIKVNVLEGVLNVLEVNNKDTRTNNSICSENKLATKYCLHCQLWTNSGLHPTH